MKDGKLKSKDFLDVKENPLITFKSTKVEQKGPNAFDVRRCIYHTRSIKSRDT